MTTKTKNVSSTIAVDEKWEYKDRTYVLMGNNAPVSYTIQAKHTPRKPLLYWDEGLKMNREIRLATNQKSLFVDEQDGYVTLSHILFQDGSLYVPRSETALQKLLSVYHPMKDKLWREIDLGRIAADEIDVLEFELEALALVKDIDIDHLEAIMRTELGSSVSSMTSKE